MEAGAGAPVLNKKDAPALKGVVGAVPGLADRHSAGCASAICTPGVKAGAVAARNLNAPGVRNAV